MLIIINVYIVVRCCSGKSKGHPVGSRLCDDARQPLDKNVHGFVCKLGWSDCTYCVKCYNHSGLSSFIFWVGSRALLTNKGCYWLTWPAVLVYFNRNMYYQFGDAEVTPSTDSNRTLLLQGKQWIEIHKCTHRIVELSGNDGRIYPCKKTSLPRIKYQDRTAVAEVVSMLTWQIVSESSSSSSTIIVAAVV